MKIRKLNKNDVEAILQLGVEQNEFDAANTDDWWSEKEIMRWVSLTDDLCIGAFKNNRLIGYLLSHIKPQLSKVFIENLFIEDNMRRNGYGEKLLLFMIEYYIEKYRNIEKLRFVALTKQDNLAFINLATKLHFNIGEKMIWVQK